MRYMLLCYDNEKEWEELGEAALQGAMQEAVELTHELDKKGQYLLASPLQSVATATSVKVRNGKHFITDGPFAETNEQLGGFYLIDVDNLDDAIRIAQRHPGARHGTVEIRPILEIEGLPQEKLSVGAGRKE
ncbi:MAG: YciI family protein [Planctomycetaceae bacterium]